MDGVTNPREAQPPRREPERKASAGVSTLVIAGLSALCWAVVILIVAALRAIV